MRQSRAPLWLSGPGVKPGLHDPAARAVGIAPPCPAAPGFPLVDGAAPRRVTRGDSFINLDLALSKAFRLTERQRLDFRTEFFNFFNRANFGLPIRTLGTPSFGSAVDTVNPARIVQIALKYSF